MARRLTDDEVRAVAAIESGSPLVRLDLAEIHDRVAAVPRIAGSRSNASCRGRSGSWSPNASPSAP